MLIAGFSEFLIIAGLIWVSIQQPFSRQNPLRALLLLCLAVTAAAASLGAIKYLTLIDTQEAHGLMTYISKHLAMPCLCILTLHHINTHFRHSPIIHMSILFLAGLSLLSFILNLWYTVSFISDAIIISSLLLAIYTHRSNAFILIFLGMGILCLSSTIVWGLLIDNDNLRIGVFHTAVSLFFLFLGLTYQKLTSEKT